jgi:molybdate transport system substrate-binding protein
VKRALGLLALVAALCFTGCGDDPGSAHPRLTVSAAASLKKAFESYASDFASAEVRYSFAGSDELAAQIRQGAKPDVFAAANTKLPDQLHDEGLVDDPDVFATNRLVLAVPEGSSKVSSLTDLEQRGVKLVIGADSVPIGSYTRDVLGRLGPDAEEKILANVRSNEPDVAGVVGKLTQGAADAGFVYVTDVAGASGKLRAIELPAQLQPHVEYGIAVVNGTSSKEEAEAFVGGLLRGRGRDALRDAGFELP